MLNYGLGPALIALCSFWSDLKMHKVQKLKSANDTVFRVFLRGVRFIVSKISSKVNLGWRLLKVSCLICSGTFTRGHRESSQNRRECETQMLMN